MVPIRRLSSALMLLAVPLLFTACGPGDTTGPPVNYYRPTSTSSTPTVTNTPPVPHYRIGEQVQVGDTWIVIVTDVTLSSGDSVSTPQTGNAYLIVDVTQQNVSSQVVAINGTVDWVVSSSTGHQYTLTQTDYGAPPNGDVQAGDSQEGQLAYEVPLGEHTFALAFAPGGGSVQAIWDLQV